MEFFKDRLVAIATKHGKESVIAPMLSDALKLRPFVVPDLDTDLLGTFSGEVERRDDPLSTARKKCQMAMELSGCDMAISSEGSFGHHPSNPFFPMNEEIVLMVDTKNQLEILGRDLSYHTNFSGQWVSSLAELEVFAQMAKFPSHGLILKNTKQDFRKVYKGIMEHKILQRAFNKLAESRDGVYVETDMRALYNPSRMAIIGAATRNLVKNATSLCPKCRAPGFSPNDVERGLPCGLCGLPTKGARFYILLCLKCGHNEKRASLETQEDPQYCDWCNP